MSGVSVLQLHTLQNSYEYEQLIAPVTLVIYKIQPSRNLDILYIWLCTFEISG